MEQSLLSIFCLVKVNSQVNYNFIYNSILISMRFLNIAPAQSLLFNDLQYTIRNSLNTCE